MGEKRVISIRFHTDSKADMDLYKQLELEAGTSTSLASVVKKRIKESYNQQKRAEENNELHERIIALIREEMQTLGMKLIGVIFSSIGKREEITVASSNITGENLPEKSEDLPNGALEFLE